MAASPSGVIRYETPKRWIAFDLAAVAGRLVDAKAAVLALAQMPYQRSWAEDLQTVQLKREVAGTSRIEGAEFTEKELDSALSDTPDQLATRSQRQAASAVSAYRWIATLPGDQPIDQALIQNIHRRMVTGCDDDHCPPGETRSDGQNVTFGAPQHRGVEGGAPCRDALDQLVEAARTSFREHDPLVQALALHYHLAALHPFLDGNGRTARAAEALMLQRIGLRDTLFIAMSNYYYEEKTAYLQALNDTRARAHDLTPFLQFALKGVEIQCRRLLAEIRTQVAKALYRNTMTDLFGRLESPRKRVMTARHVQILNLLLDVGELPANELRKRVWHLYAVENPLKALTRDLGYLRGLDAISIEKQQDSPTFLVRINLEWPTQITESEFFRRVRELPKGKVHGFLSS